METEFPVGFMSESSEEVAEVQEKRKKLYKNE